MLKLFEPTSKVQKDRQIIQQTDKRMAKYSRRGIISNLLIYSLCLLFEQTFLTQYKNWALVLTLGLLLVTVWRGYLLFRMDSIYPRGPASWRNQYFLATLVGACWWGLILSTFTLLMNLKGEAALLWLYTVVFFSTTAHAFAPYQRFLSVYQFVALVPAATCTFFIGELIGVFYGCILLFFYWVLNHHCHLISQSYWDRWEAHYSLARKAESLEEEKRDTRASVQLSKEYLNVLCRKMQNMLGSDSDVIERGASPVAVASQRVQFEDVCRNVGDFQRILTKDFVTEEHIFNARHYLQTVMRSLLEEAESRGVELETALSPALPARLLGDSVRVGQVISTAVKSVLQQQQEGVVIVEIEFMRPYEHAGELHVTVARQVSSAKRSFFHTEQAHVLDINLDLVLAKGIADVLGGSLDIDEGGAKDGKNVLFRVPLGVAEANSRPEYHRLEYRGRQLMLIHHNPRWLDHKRLELDTMGFEVQTASHYKKGVQELTRAVTAGSPFDLVVYYATPGDDSSVQFCDDLLSSQELRQIQQFVVCSSTGRRFFRERILQLTPTIHFIDKPAGFFEFDLSFSGVFELQVPQFSDAESTHNNQSLKVIWVASGKDSDTATLYDDSSISIHRVGEVRQIDKYLESNDYDLAIVEYSGGEKFEGVAAIRAFERSSNAESLVPIIGVGPHEVQEDMLAYGADHVVDIESLVAGDPRTLRYWAKGRHL